MLLLLNRVCFPFFGSLYDCNHFASVLSSACLLVALVGCSLVVFVAPAVGLYSVFIPPLPNTKTNPTKYASKTAASRKADDTTQPGSGQHLNWVPNASTRGLGALLPGQSLFVLYLRRRRCPSRHDGLNSPHKRQGYDPK